MRSCEIVDVANFITSVSCHQSGTLPRYLYSSIYSCQTQFEWNELFQMENAPLGITAVDQCILDDIPKGAEGDYKYIAKILQMVFGKEALTTGTQREIKEKLRASRRTRLIRSNFRLN